MPPPDSWTEHGDTKGIEKTYLEILPEQLVNEMKIIWVKL